MSTMTPIANSRSQKKPGRTTRSDLSKSALRSASGEAMSEVRKRILDTASSLFYQHGIRAVGVDLVVLEAAVAKTSLYRYFPTKDDLIVAFLEREDHQFWSLWDSISVKHANAPESELQAHMHWIGERLGRSNYRGCPQINVAAEFAEPSHPARQVSQQHMQSLLRRLHAIAKRLDVRQPELLATQLAVLVNGAFVSSALLNPKEATNVLLTSLKALLTAARARR
jgi:AcrR family transcriptional regulator